MAGALETGRVIGDVRRDASWLVQSRLLSLVSAIRAGVTQLG